MKNVSTTFTLITLLLFSLFTTTSNAQPQQISNSTIGVIVLHGKGGTPSSKISGLTQALKREGFLTRSPTMPWTGNKGTAYYLESLEQGWQQISDEITDLKNQGAEKIFLAGHSLGASVGLSYAVHRGNIDGFIAIAIGHITGSRYHNNVTGSSVSKAREMVSNGLGDQKAWFKDYNVGIKPQVNTTAEIYLSYFDPDRNLNVITNSAQLKGIPILFIAPRNDPITKKGGPRRVFGRISDHPLNRYQLIDGGHGSAPSKGKGKIIQWITEISHQ